MHLPVPKLHFFPSLQLFLHGLKLLALIGAFFLGGFTHLLVSSLHILLTATQSFLQGPVATTLALGTLLTTTFFSLGALMHLPEV